MTDFSEVSGPISLPWNKTITMADNVNGNVYRSLMQWSGLSQANDQYYAASVPHQASAVAAWIIASTSQFSQDSWISNTAQPYIYQTCQTSFLPDAPSNISSQYISFGENHPELNTVLTYADLWFDNSTRSSPSCQEFASLAVPSNSQNNGWCSLDLPSFNHTLLTVTTWLDGGQEGYYDQLIGQTTCVIRAQWIKSRIEFASAPAIVAVGDSVVRFNSSAASFIKIHAGWVKRAASLFLKTSSLADLVTYELGATSAAMLSIALSNTGPPFRGTFTQEEGRGNLTNPLTLFYKASQILLVRLHLRIIPLFKNRIILKHDLSRVLLIDSDID